MFPIIPSPVRQKQRIPNSDSAGAICHSGRGQWYFDKHSWGEAGLSFSPGKRTFFFLFLSRQAHRCCWILVSQHKIWAHGSELFIVGSQPVCLCLAGLLQPWSAMFDAAHLWCCSFPTTWTELVCLAKARLFCLDAKVEGQGKEQPR